MAVKSKPAKRAAVKKPVSKPHHSPARPRHKPKLEVHAFGRGDNGWTQLTVDDLAAAVARVQESLSSPYGVADLNLITAGFGSGSVGSASVGMTSNNQGVAPDNHPLPTCLAASILREAANVVEGSREKTHGQKERSFIAIAGAWNAYLAARRDPTAPITATDVCWMMNWMKTVRSVQGEFVRDHAVDAAGYAAIAGEVGFAV
jgi:hypothetical protein